jgi:hypothetical protein
VSMRLFINLESIHDSVRSEIIYNNLIEVNVLIKLFRIIKMRLNETHKAKQIYV